MSEATNAIKSGFTVRGVLMVLASLFAVFLILDIVGIFVPTVALVPRFFMNPVSTIRSYWAARQAANK